MSERPKWMPSREGLLPMCHNESLYDNCKYDYAGDEVEESHYRTGLRAQIAVLEELNAAMTKQNGGSFCNEESEWSNAKIAALKSDFARCADGIEDALAELDAAEGR